MRCLTVRVERCFQIDVGDDLSVDDEKRIAIEELTRVVERATGAEDLRFFNVVQLHSEAAAVAEGLAHRLRAVMQVDDDLVKAIRGQIFRHVTDKRFTKNGNRGFRAIFGKRPEACAVTGGQNYRTHGRTTDVTD